MAGIKRVYCKKLNRIPYKSISKISPLCNKIPPYIKILLSPHEMRRVPAAIFRQRSVASDPANGRYCIEQLYSAANGVSPRPCPASGVSPQPYSANERYYITKPVTRTAGFINNITMPRSARRLRRAPFFYLKQIARAKHPTLSRGLCAMAHLLLRST